MTLKQTGRACAINTRPAHGHSVSKPRKVHSTMTIKKGTQKKGAQSMPDDLEAFAHHMAEVLRIAKTHPLLTTRFYRDLSSAWNECVNELKTFNDSSLQESEEYIRLALGMEAEREGGE